MAAVALVTGLAFAGVGSTAAGASTVPFRDPAAQGYLGLCDAAGHQITSGSTLTVPFAWRVVSTQPAPAPYDNSYRTAILLAYQPQNGLTPGEWSGEELTASSRYSNPAHPMAAAATGDLSLAEFVGDYPPRWDGLVQLRLYLGTANAPVYSLHYPTLDLRVSGTTWRALDGGSVNCHAGTAESLESIVLRSTTTTTSSTTTTVVSAATAAPSHSWWWVVAAVVGLILVGSVALRRRHPHDPSDSVSPDPERHTP